MTASVGRSGWMPDARTGSVRRDAETAGSQGTAMITRAKFQNFKALRDVEITFDSRLTVLVGPNGSGKTSVLQGLQFLGLHFRTMAFPSVFHAYTERGSREVWGWQHYPQFPFERAAVKNSVVAAMGEYA